jgi:hypothetical protein
VIDLNQKNVAIEATVMAQVTRWRELWSTESVEDGRTLLRRLPGQHVTVNRGPARDRLTRSRKAVTSADHMQLRAQSSGVP